MICIHGKQLKPPGQSGIYFICQYGLYKGNHCRFARWCSDSRSYISITDKHGNACPNFATEETVKQQKIIDKRIEEILDNPCDCGKKELEQIIKEPIEKIVEESTEVPVENIVEELAKEPIKKTVEKAENKKEETAEQIAEETAEQIAEEIADEIFNNFIKQSKKKTAIKPKIKTVVGVNPKLNEEIIAKIRQQKNK